MQHMFSGPNETNAKWKYYYIVVKPQLGFSRLAHFLFLCPLEVFKPISDFSDFFEKSDSLCRPISCKLFGILLYNLQQSCSPEYNKYFCWTLWYQKITSNTRNTRIVQKSLIFHPLFYGFWLLATKPLQIQNYNLQQKCTLGPFMI